MRRQWSSLWQKQCTHACTRTQPHIHTLTHTRTTHTCTHNTHAHTQHTRTCTHAHTHTLVQAVEHIMTRNIAGLGTDTPSTDVSTSFNFFVQKHVLGAGAFSALCCVHVCTLSMNDFISLFFSWELVRSVRCAVCMCAR